MDINSTTDYVLISVYMHVTVCIVSSPDDLQYNISIQRVYTRVGYIYNVPRNWPPSKHVAISHTSIHIQTLIDQI
jgi:hypothetical protein